MEVKWYSENEMIYYYGLWQFHQSFTCFFYLLVVQCLVGLHLHMLIQH